MARVDRLDEHSPPVHSLSVGDVLGTTLGVMARCAVPLGLLTVAAVAPFVLLDLVTLESDPLPGLNIVSAIVDSWYFAAATLLTYDALIGRPGTLSQTGREATRFIGGVFGVNLLSGILIALGTLVFVIPGVILWLMLCLAVPIRVLEERKVGATLKRSFELTSGHWGSIFLGFGLPHFAVVAVLLAVAFGPWVLELSSGPAAAAPWTSTRMLFATTVGLGVLQAFSQAFMSVAATVVYVRLSPSAGKVDADELVDVFS